MNKFPQFLYGTAWKKEETQQHVENALRAGFRGIDTANQIKHYYEQGVADAVLKFIDDGKLKREDLFLQTKFTHISSQDHRLPYDPDADITTQVQQSFASSLEHFKTKYLDSYLLHGPSMRGDLSDEDWEAWRAIESLHVSGQAEHIGVSNFDPRQMQILLDNCTVKPAFVQNRCYARMKWDAEVREICQKNGVVYQGFSLLTANVNELHCEPVLQIARRLNATIPQVVFAFCLKVGMLPLTGTTDPKHMSEDLVSDKFVLTEDEVQAIENVAFL